MNQEACARQIQNEGFRLIGATKVHRVTMLAALDDPDVKTQRGNAFAFGRTEGIVAGIAVALRAFGFTDKADQLEHALDNIDQEGDTA